MFQILGGYEDPARGIRQCRILQHDRRGGAVDGGELCSIAGSRTIVEHSSIGAYALRVGTDHGEEDRQRAGLVREVTANPGHVDDSVAIEVPGRRIVDRRQIVTRRRLRHQLGLEPNSLARVIWIDGATYLDGFDVDEQDVVEAIDRQLDPSGIRDKSLIRNRGRSVNRASHGKREVVIARVRRAVRQNIGIAHPWAQGHHHVVREIEQAGKAGLLRKGLNAIGQTGDLRIAG